MIVLGIDTSTAATAVALAIDGRAAGEERDDPAAGEHPGHATRLLAMADALLRARGLEWAALARVAVGAGPGRFTGLRVGLATARGLAHSLQCELAVVSSLEALAAAALAAVPSDGVLAVIDARREEVFAAAYMAAQGAEKGRLTAPRELAGARVLAPERAHELLAGAAPRSWLAVGDGALRYADALARAGVEVAPAASGLHLVRAAAVAELGAGAAPAQAREQVLPEYLRRPDAELALGDARVRRATRA